MSTVIMLAVVACIYLVARRCARRAEKPKQALDPLDIPLFWWTRDDPFSIRDLLRSIVIMGAAGSGKTSSVGMLLGRALARNPRIGGVIIASKPEDREMWTSIFGDRLTVFAPDQPHRFNVIDFEAMNGADAREITQLLMTIGESLQKTEGGGRDPFWHQQNARTTHNAVEIVYQAHGKVSTHDIQRFIANAPTSGEQLLSEEWQKGYHCTTSRLAFERAKTPIEAHDYEQARAFFFNEWPHLATETRSSILAGVMGLLHAFNTGVVRELIGTETTITPASLAPGQWLLVDMPIANYGVAGAFVAGAWKYAVQRHVLRRKADANTPVTCLWIDKYQNHITSYDAKYLAECRSHLGCMAVLTQSMHSFFSAMGGRDAQSKTKALLTNLATKVFMALGDEESARYASSLVGRAIIRLASSSRNGAGPLFEEIVGNYNLGTSLSEHFEDLIQARLFMNGLKTGGPENGFVAEGWVIKNGTPFSNGENAMLVGFSQK